MRDFIDNFLKYLVVEKGFSKNTREAYHNDLCQLESFITVEASKQGEMPSWERFDHQAMLSYMLTLKEKSYASPTLARKIAATKSFFKFLTDDLRLDPRATAEVIWRDYQRGGRHDKPSFLKDLLPADKRSVSPRQSASALPKRQARHLV